MNPGGDEGSSSPRASTRRGARALPQRDPRRGRGRVRRAGLPRRAHPGHRRARAHRRRHRLQPLRGQGRRARGAARAALRGDDSRSFAAARTTGADSRRGCVARVARVLAYVQRAPRLLRHRQRARPLRGDRGPRRARRAEARCASVEKFRAVFRALVEEGIASGDLEPGYGDALVRFLGGHHPRVRPLDASPSGRPTSQEDASTIVELFLHGAARRRKSRPLRKKG